MADTVGTRLAGMTRASQLAALRQRQRIRWLAGQALLWAFVGAGLLIMVFPGVWMILSSFKTLAEVSAVPMQFFPRQWVWQNYADAIKWTRFPRVFLNSTIIAVSITVAQVVTGTWGGYVFSKLRWPGRDAVLLALLATMMIPGFLSLIPRYVLVIKLGMINKYSGMIVPALMSTFGIFMTRQFMLGIPDDYIDAATVDGCSAFGIYWRIILPLCRPIIAVLAIFTFTGAWDDLLWGTMVLTSRDMWTIPVAINTLKTQEQFQYQVQFAGAALAIIPVLIVFLFFQKHIIEGVALSGVKG